MFYKHLKGVVSPEDCAAIIDRGYAIGFEKALVNQGDGTQKMMEHVRNNERALFSDTQLAIGLDCCLSQEIPLEFKDATFDHVGSFFRLYKYVPGQYFKTHRDGSFKDTDGTESEITVLLYLNDTDGGETVLMPYGKVLTDTYIRIQPKQGDVLMFEHNILHSGEPVLSGVKYVLRTDIFYCGGEANE